MITYSISIPILDIAYACAILGAMCISVGVIYAAGILTGPHWDGGSFAPVSRCLLWRKK